MDLVAWLFSERWWITSLRQTVYSVDGQLILVCCHHIQTTYFFISKLQIVLFNMQHPIFGINSLILSMSLIHILVFHLLTILHTSGSLCHYQHCHLQLVLHFFTLDLKHTSSSSLRLLHRYSLDWFHGLPVRPFSLAHRICYSFSSRLRTVD